MKPTKWRKWRLSKRLFPTKQIKGSNRGQGGGTRGENIPGHKAAAAHLGRMLGTERVGQMTITDTRTEWVFMEAV